MLCMSGEMFDALQKKWDAMDLVRIRSRLG